MPDTPVEPKPDAPYPALEMRVSGLECDVHEVKGAMSQLELLVTEIKATLPHLRDEGRTIGDTGGMERRLGAAAHGGGRYAR